MQAQARPNPSMERASGHEGPPVAKKLLATDSCWEGESQFSLSAVVFYAPVESHTFKNIWAEQI